MGAMTRLGAALLAIVACGPAVADAEPVMLRFATAAPEGTAWARELRAWARDVELDSGGAVRIKWYLGGVAGDEMEVFERMKRKQLDGVASGGPICERIAPSLKVTRVLGLIRDHAESAAILTKMHPRFVEEGNDHGFAFLGASPIGAHILFTRRPIKSIEDMKNVKLWVWDLDDLLRRELLALSVQAVPASLTEAGPLYDAGKVDGLVTPASVALAFQWSTRTRYFIALPLEMLNGCVTMTRGALDSLPIAAQRAIKNASAKLAVRFNDLSRRQDEELLGGLLQKQGLTRVALDQRFLADFYEIARRTRLGLDRNMISPELLQQIQSMLADFRAEHSPAPAPRPKLPR